VGRCQGTPLTPLGKEKRGVNTCAILDALDALGVWLSGSLALPLAKFKLSLTGGSRPFLPACESDGRLNGLGNHNRI
jgi:hypothetical protein